MIIRKVFACMLAFAVVIAMSAVMLTEPVSAASLSTPVMTIHAASTSSIQVNWKKVSGATRYVVYVSKAYSKNIDKEYVTCSKKGVVSANKKSYLIKGLKKNKHYAIFVVAQKVVKGKVKAESQCGWQQCMPSISMQYYCPMPDPASNELESITFSITNYSSKSILMTADLAYFYPDYNADAYSEGVISGSTTVIRPGETKEVNYYFETDETTFDQTNSGFALPAKYNGKACLVII